MTFREKLIKATKELEQAGIYCPENDAKILMEYVTKMSSTELILNALDQFPSQFEEQYDSLIEKRKGNYPLQYITNEAPFMDYIFTARENVLIPRFDTEILVIEALKKAREKGNALKVLDMCCGSGCIGISYYLERKKEGVEDAVSLVDISEYAIALSNENKNKLNADVKIIKSDLYSEISDEKYDLILSNPPYIRTADIEDLMAEVKDHEPHLALDGTENGLYFYKRIIEGLKEHLNDNGSIIFEIGCDQYEAVKGLLVEAAFKDIEVVKDLAGLDRVVKADK
ncbi:MAG: peptide chain release factor N(5)-glutamine methyltransferase [Eubacterium sp.]|nr:peptide chain release factor N(5)-glutamine methyltransferase [Eubacterium sp.]